MAKRPAQTLTGDPVDVAFFDELMNRHLPRLFIRVMRRLPSEPRCRLGHTPYGGAGGRIMRRFGFGPSRKNPNLCNPCFEKAPMGGVEMEIGVLNRRSDRTICPAAAEDCRRAAVFTTSRPARLRPPNATATKDFTALGNAST